MVIACQDELYYLPLSRLHGILPKPEGGGARRGLTLSNIFRLLIHLLQFGLLVINLSTYCTSQAPHSLC